MTDFIVTNTNDSGSGSLRQAILDANAADGADSIVFDSALSGQTIMLNTGELAIEDDLTIDGDLNNDGTPDITIRRDASAEEFRILNLDDGNDAVEREITLEGLVISGGKLPSESDGSGIRNVEGLMLLNSIVTKNRNPGYSDVKGAGVFNAGTATIQNSLISDNSSYDNGSGIYNSGEIVISDTSVVNNFGSFSDGGGIFNKGKAKILSSRITRNGNYDGDGSGVFNDGEITITNSRIVDNFNNISGGGFFNSENGVAAIRNTDLSRNRSGYSGGGLSNYGDLSISGSAIFGNRAQGGVEDIGNITGGGITNGTGGTLLVRNSTIAGNSTDELFEYDPYYGPPLGAGVYNLGSATFRNTTISGNIVEGENSEGGGIFNRGNITLDSTIVGDNTSDTANPDVFNDGGSVLARFSGIEDGAITDDQGGNLVGIDLRLDPAGAQNNGGATRTVALQPDSPAINAGRNPNALEFDQRGDGFDRQVGEQIDIGAFELQFIPATELAIGLFDADSDTLIASLLDTGSTILASNIEGRRLSIAAFVPDDSPFSGRVESAFLDFNNGQVTRTENSEPYSLFGDIGGDFAGGTIPVGQNTISFDLFSKDRRKGKLLGTVERSFTVVDDSSDLEVGLFDADTNTLIASIGEEEITILLSDIRGRNLSIAAFVPEESQFSGRVESAFLDFNNGQVTRTENSEPYSLFGDIGGDFAGGMIPIGQNTVSFDLFSRDRRRGKLLGTVERSFTVIDNFTGISIGLFDADTDRRLTTLSDGTEIDSSLLENRSVNIAALIPSSGALSDQVESMVINLNNGEVIRTENSNPYAIFGDLEGDYFGGSLSTGVNQISFDLFSENGGRGDLIDTISLEFTIVA
ncbi:MAG: choice-of-anchor Q domain-containing protein [Cyanobacteria bacterium P01_E01_bin.45]